MEFSFCNQFEEKNASKLDEKLNFYMPSKYPKFRNLDPVLEVNLRNMFTIFSKPGYTSITCSKIEHISYNLIFTTKCMILRF